MLQHCLSCDIDAEGQVEYLMMYRSDGSAQAEFARRDGQRVPSHIEKRKASLHGIRTERTRF